ncbi:FAD-dependent monooxygenase [Lentzea chajnantorensis]
MLDELDRSRDVYVDQLTQIRMTTWHRGRVCLAGDAAWCVTPMGGGGASLALISGYVLAAALSANGVEDGLAAYGKWMRPLVDDVQNFPRWVLRFAFPQTARGLRLRHLADRVVTSRLLAPLTAKVTQVADSQQALPPITLPQA